MSETLVIDDLTFAIHRSTRRSTIGVTVERDGSLTLSVPTACSTDTIEQVARAKQFWVYTKLAEKHLLAHPPAVKEFVSGEGFFYLGRSYRLLLATPALGAVIAPPLRLFQGRFLLRRDAQAAARQHFMHWYSVHAQPWLTQRVAAYAERIGVTPRSINVRDLQYRWGSCGHSGSLNFHWRTILLPPRIIDYIVLHELVHLHEAHHDTAFWQRLERAMPDYAARKQWLAAEGGRFDLCTAIINPSQKLRENTA